MNSYSNKIVQKTDDGFLALGCHGHFGVKKIQLLCPSQEAYELTTSTSTTNKVRRVALNSRRKDTAKGCIKVCPLLLQFDPISLAYAYARLTVVRRIVTQYVVFHTQEY